MKKEKQKKQRDFILVCPKCKSTHDVTEQLNVWRSEFLSYLDKAVEEMKR